MRKQLDRHELADLILEHAPEYAVCTFDEEGRVTGWSPGAERVFGFTHDEAMGMSIAAIFLGADRAAGAPELERETARADGRVENSRWHRRKDGERFWANGITVALEPTPEQSAAFLKIVRDETPLKLADEQRVLLLNELNHRVKNTLATVQSISDQTLRAGNVQIEVREALTRRLQALSQAHDILVTESWAGADLQAVTEQALAPHMHDNLETIVLEGPPVRVSAQQAVSISLVLHELATNAVKHGALSQPGGRVSLSWNTALDGQGQRHMSLLWSETGGPPVAEPSRQGFGTRLISRSFGARAEGEAKLEFRPDGLQCAISMPLPHAGETPMLDLRAAKPASHSN